MFRSYRRLLLVLAVLGLMFPTARSVAQAPATPPPPTPTPVADVDPLPNFPHPPDVPRSMSQPPPPALLYANSDLTGSFFESHPLLDPPQLPPVGWYFDAEMSVIAPHLKTSLIDTVQLGNYSPDIVDLKSAGQDWTVAPRLELGYRLPAGLGELSMGYRLFGSDGSTTTPSTDGTADLHSRLDVNQLDFDYSSREFSLWPQWDMRWRVGVRTAWVYFDSRADESFQAAYYGSGVYEQRVSNSYWGIGPHVGLELGRRFESSGISLISKVDVTDMLGRIRQGYFESSFLAGPNGQPLTGETRDSGSQSVPVLSAQFGVQWQSPRYPNATLFVGYNYEYWWNVGKLSGLGTTGELADQGIVFRAEVNF